MIAATPASSKRRPSPRRSCWRSAPSPRRPRARPWRRCPPRSCRDAGAPPRGRRRDRARRRADDHPGDALGEPALQRLHFADAAAELHRDADRARIASTAAALRGAPAKAPSRSTTWSQGKPAPRRSRPARPDRRRRSWPAPCPWTSGDAASVPSGRSPGTGSRVLSSFSPKSGARFRGARSENFAMSAPGRGADSSRGGIAVPATLPRATIAVTGPP